jgi:hypothetical protein
MPFFIPKRTSLGGQSWWPNEILFKYKNLSQKYFNHISKRHEICYLKKTFDYFKFAYDGDIMFKF